MASVESLPEKSGVLSPQALARTYEPPAYADAWECVEDYQRVRRAAGRHPNLGSSALSSRVELPRGRIRTWMDGGAPDAARAVADAHDRGWFDPDEETTAAWGVLFAGILGGGSVNVERFVPTWTVTPTVSAESVRGALDRFSVPHRTLDRDGRANEIAPTEVSSVLGRALVALGAPKGDKAPEAVGPLPNWLLNGSEQVRQMAALTLISYRGVGRGNQDLVQLYEVRSTEYHQSVAELLRGIVDGSVFVNKRGVTISAAAARELGFGRGGRHRDAIEAQE